MYIFSVIAKIATDLLMFPCNCPLFHSPPPFICQETQLICLTLCPPPPFAKKFNSSVYVTFTFAKKYNSFVNVPLLFAKKLVSNDLCMSPVLFVKKQPICLFSLYVPRNTTHLFMSPTLSPSFRQLCEYQHLFLRGRINAMLKNHYVSVNLSSTFTICLFH